MDRAVGRHRGGRGIAAVDGGDESDTGLSATELAGQLVSDRASGLLVVRVGADLLRLPSGPLLLFLQVVEVLLQKAFLVDSALLGPSHGRYLPEARLDEPSL